MAGDKVRKTGKVRFVEVWMMSAVNNRKINFNNFKQEEVYYPTEQEEQRHMVTGLDMSSAQPQHQG